MGKNEKTLRLEPYSYIHVLDHLTLKTRIELGPMTFVRRDYEEVTEGPKKMINLPPKSYVKIQNPVVMSNKTVTHDKHGGYKLSYGETEIRTSEDYLDPFPLYPGEVNLTPTPSEFVVISKDQAIQISVIRNINEKDNHRQAGSVYQLMGPLTYIPRKEEEFVAKISKKVIKANTAIKLVGKGNFVDRDGVKRRTGEEWYYDKVGSFIPGVYEEIKKMVQGYVLTDKKALWIRAEQDFVDKFGVQRKAGERWLVTNTMAPMYIPSVNENVVKEEKSTVLSNREFVEIRNPYKAADPKHPEKKAIQRGETEIRVGELTFFTYPGEEIIRKENLLVLAEDEAIILQAMQGFHDTEYKLQRKAGEKWLMRGPREYIPMVEVTVLSRRKDIALDSSEGVYIRDNNTGEVRAAIGETVMLKVDEELWEKKIYPKTAELLNRRYDVDATRVVTYPAGDNTAVLIFDFKTGTSRVVFGPELLMLGPYEEIKRMEISGGVPKKEKMERLICLPLGQNNFEDEIIVETQDHAALVMKLSYCAHFKKEDPEVKKDPKKLFNINDFIGNTCKTVASRIRGNVSQIVYNEFHHNYSSIVRNAVFGEGNECFFPENSFVLTECDVKSLEPADIDIREKLKKNTAMSIELKTQASELEYQMKSAIMEQESQGELLLQKLDDEYKAAEQGVKLDKLHAESEAITKAGEKLAEAKATTQRRTIESESELEQKKHNHTAYDYETDAIIKGVVMENKFDETSEWEKNEMELTKLSEMANIEIKKFKQVVNAIGRETICAMAKSGPETKAKLLKSLGLEGYLVTDGKTPINLFGAANGMINPSY